MTYDKSKETKGRLWWKRRWSSICSMHGWEGHQIECPACQAGSWTNIWKNKIGGVVYYISPKFWVWYMNRPNSKARKQIMKIFPKLK